VFIAGRFTTTGLIGVGAVATAQQACGLHCVRAALVSLPPPAVFLKMHHPLAIAGARACGAGSVRGLSVRVVRARIIVRGQGRCRFGCYLACNWFETKKWLEKLVTRQLHQPKLFVCAS
jgi:hypothetical protein